MNSYIQDMVQKEAKYIMVFNQMCSLSKKKKTKRFCICFKITTLHIKATIKIILKI